MARPKKDKISEPKVGFPEKAKDVEEYGKKGKGKVELLQWYKTGKPLTRTQAINAYCYDCSGYAADGAEDCGCTACPLYPFHPYSTEKKTTRVLSPEHLAALQAARSKIKKKE
jgi:hypothetical protein